MKTKLARSLVLPGILLAIWGARAQAGNGPPPADPAARRAVKGQGTIDPLPAPCLLGNDFETGTVEGWGSTNTSNFSVRHPGSSSTSCLYAHDASGGSTINAPPSYLGDWIQKLKDKHCACGNFCYDVNLLANPGQPSPLASSFVLYGPNGTYAIFRSNLLISAGSGWHRFCAPIRLNGATPPAGTDGTWILFGTSPSWDNIVQHVSSLRVPVDWSNGDQVEEVEYDNLCLRCGGAKPDFTWTRVCAPQASQLTSTSTNAVTWSWSYAGQTFSNQPNATFPVSQAGTYPVTLCVTSACGGPPACVTHLVTVGGPAPFTVTGPLYASSGSAVYCATPPQVSPPVTYGWSVPLPATATPVSGNPSCATVIWNGLNGGLVTATATPTGGPQCPQSAELQVKPDTGPDRECCHATTLAVTGVQFTPLSSPPGAYQLHASLSAGPGLFTRVTAEVLSTTATYPASSTCGQSGPVESHVLGALPLGPLAAALPVPGSHEVWWQGGQTALSGTPATVSLQLPPFGGACSPDKLTVCMKYSFSSTSCRTCQLIECYDVLPPVCVGCN